MISFSTTSSWLLLLAAAAITTNINNHVSAHPQGQLHARPSYIGPRDRFWRHNREQKTLPWKGVDMYQPMYHCLFHEDGSLTEQERLQLEELAQDPTSPNSPHKAIGQRIVDTKDDRFGNIILVEVTHAMEPVQAKAVQRLAHCVKTHIPEYYEVRAMYKEFNLDVDPGLGGNSPTHLMPFLGIFLPSVPDTILQTVRFAYNAAGWQGITLRDKLLGKMSDDPEAPVSKEQGILRAAAMPEPEQLGFRASEFLSYADFPLLDAHHDGTDTAYTVNFAFAGPDDYQGGYLYVIDKAGEQTFFKPMKYSCVVFLGGHYLHGVTKISGGHREMFSNELWFNPDIPLGASLWNARAPSMDAFIRECNKLGHTAGSGPCNATFSDATVHGVSREELLSGKYSTSQEDYDRNFGEDEDLSGSNSEDEDMSSSSSNDEDDEEYWEEEFRYAPENNYMGPQEQPNFLVPQQLEPGQMAPLYWRDNKERVKDDEAFAIGLPKELLQEFTKYVENNGLLDVARKLSYPETNIGKDQVEPFEEGLEHKIYTLKDGQTWGTMRPKWNGMDMIWIDPGDEECFESLLHVLRKGNFDTVLQSIAEYFNLDGLMIQGIGPIFLSHFAHDPNYKQIHHDLIEAKGYFYNVIVPLYIPEGGAKLYVGDMERALPVEMQYNVGTLLGAGTRHGTGECDYRDQKDVRLSVAIYLADVNKDNAEIIASDSTSLWPSEGDVYWFLSQQGRFWRRDASNRSLKNDRGRIRLNVADKRGDCQKRKDRCISDPAGFRLDCPKTCRVYMEDEEYYAKLQSMVEENNQMPRATK